VERNRDEEREAHLPETRRKRPATQADESSDGGEGGMACLIGAFWGEIWSVSGGGI